LFSVMVRIIGWDHPVGGCRSSFRRYAARVAAGWTSPWGGLNAESRTSWGSSLDHRWRPATWRALRASYGTSSWPGRCSTPCWRPRCWLSDGGGRTTPSAQTARRSTAPGPGVAPPLSGRV